MNSMPSIGPSLPAVVKDSPLLLQEIENLRKLFHSERNERLKLQTERLKQQLDNLVPLPSFRNEQDLVLESLFKEGIKLKKVYSVISVYFALISIYFSYRIY